MCLAANETGAVWFAAVTGLGVGAVAVDIVVESEFFSGFNAALGEDAHAESIANNPFVDKTVRVARMVAESAEVALFCCINKLSFAERHEIKVFDALLVILVHAPSEGGL